jgi:hypothetical protein
LGKEAPLPQGQAQEDEMQEIVYVMWCPVAERFLYVFGGTAKVRLKCPQCGKRHDVEQTAFKKLPDDAHPRVQFRPHYSYAHGRKLESWQDLERTNKEQGLIYTGRRDDTKFPPANRTVVRRP